MTRHIATGCAFLWTIFLATLPAVAQIDGLHVRPRVFNDFPTSTLTINSSNSVDPGTVVLDERDFDTGPGGFANRHDILLSSDAGATAQEFSINEPFMLSAHVTLAVGSDAPRKEAGIRVTSPVTGDALFLINSDAGEIVAFGGGAPFHLFGNHGGGNGYALGSTILMGMSYTPGSPGQVEYFIDRGLGIESSGMLPWANLEGGPVSYNVGLYGQFSPANNDDFATVSFDRIATIPEPATVVGLTWIVAVCALHRKRRRCANGLLAASRE